MSDHGIVSNEGLHWILPDRLVSWKFAGELEPGDRIVSPWAHEQRMVTITRTEPWPYGDEHVEIGWDDPTITVGPGASKAYPVDAVILVFIELAPPPT